MFDNQSIFDWDGRIIRVFSNHPPPACPSTPPVAQFSGIFQWKNDVTKRHVCVAMPRKSRSANCEKKKAATMRLGKISMKNSSQDRSWSQNSSSNDLANTLRLGTCTHKFAYIHLLSFFDRKNRHKMWYSDWSSIAKAARVWWLEKRPTKGKNGNLRRTIKLVKQWENFPKR
jgi:hypothetical protein